MTTTQAKDELISGNVTCSVIRQYGFNHSLCSQSHAYGADHEGCGKQVKWAQIRRNVCDIQYWYAKRRRFLLLFMSFIRT